METKAELRENLRLSRELVARLIYVIDSTLWMAQRYADNRCTYATQQFNEALQLANSLTDDMFYRIPYAKDGMFGTWNPEFNTWNKNIDSPKEEV